MEWLAKATDLLDKVDQLAAERLADEEDAEVADEDVLALLDAAEREEEPAAHAPAGDAAAAAATEAAAPARTAYRTRSTVTVREDPRRRCRGPLPGRVGTASSGGQAQAELRAVRSAGRAPTCTFAARRNGKRQSGTPTACCNLSTSRCPFERRSSCPSRRAAASAATAPRSWIPATARPRIPARPLLPGRGMTSGRQLSSGRTISSAVWTRRTMQLSATR